MTILVDMDDTIIDFLGALCSSMREKYGYHIRPEEMHEWDLTESFPELTIEEILEPTFSESFWQTVKPRFDAMKYLQKLHDDGEDIYIVTAADCRSIKFRFDYIIKRFFPYIDNEHFIVASKKQMVIGDLLIDDGIHNLEGGHYDKILYTMSHNQSYDAEENGMMRADTWEDIYRIIQNKEHKSTYTYTPEFVRSMTKEEIQKNYHKILLSMSGWD